MGVKVKIKDQEGNLFVFKATVDEGDSTSIHEVEVDKAYVERLGYGSPEKLVEDSFEFLLSREPKESILPEFNLREISRYFPNFEQKIQK